MTLGLGTGSTVAFLLPALARRQLDGLVCVATSPATEQAALALGIDVRPFDEIDRLDLAIDGADQVSPGSWVVKGAGGAHVREKVVASAAERFVVIVSPDKLVEAVRAPVPVELLEFGLRATIRSLGDVRLRVGAPRSPDGGLIADWWGSGGAGAGAELDVDPAELAVALDREAGVIGHGLFPPELVHDVIVGYADGRTETLFG